MSKTVEGLAYSTYLRLSTEDAYYRMAANVHFFSFHTIDSKGSDSHLRNHHSTGQHCLNYFLRFTESSKQTHHRTPGLM